MVPGRQGRRDSEEDAARLKYQRLHFDLGPPLDSKLSDYLLPIDPLLARNQLQDIGRRQHWSALSLGDARALAEAVTAAWGSGKYGRLSLADREALDAVSEISNFGVGRLAEILASTEAGQRGLAVWRFP